MLKTKWSPPAGGTGMSGNSVEILLLIICLHPNEGVRGSRDGGILFVQNYL